MCETVFDFRISVVLLRETFRMMSAQGFDFLFQTLPSARAVSNDVEILDRDLSCTLFSSCYRLGAMSK